MTLYKEVKRQMLLALARNEWSPGELIPSEKQLSLHFAVSIGTLRKAIDDLVAENILIRHQGRGTYVALHNRSQQLFRFFNVVRHDGLKTYPTLELIDFAKVTADRIAADKLGISGRAKVFRFVNVSSLGGEPVLVEQISLPEARFAGLTEAQLRTRANTLYSLYQVSFGVNVIRIDERLRATLANAELAQLLDIAIGTPLLEKHRVAYSYHDQPVEWRVSYINTADYEYFATQAQ